jgi:hypothetical protein
MSWLTVSGGIAARVPGGKDKRKRNGNIENTNGGKNKWETTRKKTILKTAR